MSSGFRLTFPRPTCSTRLVDDSHRFTAFLKSKRLATASGSFLLAHAWYFNPFNTGLVAEIVAYLTKSAADQCIRRWEPCFPVSVVFVKPLNGRAGIFNHFAPFCHVETELNMWWADEADSHEYSPKNHGNTCIVEVKKACNRVNLRGYYCMMTLPAAGPESGPVNANSSGRCIFHSSRRRSISSKMASFAL
jgi:hypothetical protein